LKSVASNQWAAHHVHEFAQPLAQEIQVQADQPLLDVMGQLESQGVQALAVIRSNGTLMGLLEKAQIVRLLQHEGQAQPA
ncbi:MAG: site-2 protease family protein, partial [Cyanobacteria bacterium P01_C01_bin.121]